MHPFARWIARTFAPPSGRRTRPTRRPKLGLETLESREVPSVTTYDRDFEPNKTATLAPGVTAAWSQTGKSTSPSGQTFLGEFGNQTVTLNLNNLPSHNQLTVEFDLYLIRSWDGNDPTWGGPNGDRWSLKTDGATLLDTTFRTPRTLPTSDFGQEFGGQGVTGPGPFAPGTAAAAVNTLGYTFNGGNGNQSLNAIYHFSYPINHTGSTLTLAFAGSGLQGLSDESWGLDNVKVVSDTLPAVTAVDDGYSIGFGQTLSIPASDGVLRNDLANGGPALTAVAASGATAHGGSYTLSADGSFTYTPPTGYAGADSFTYTATNGTTSSPATVNLTIKNQVALIGGVVLSVMEGETTNLRRLATFTNDTGSNNLATTTSTIDWGDGTISDGDLFTDASGNGECEIADAHTYIAAGTYTYTVHLYYDGIFVGSTTGTATVSSFVATADTYYVAHDWVLTIGSGSGQGGVLVNDLSNPASLTITDWSPAQHGTLEVHADGTFVYVPSPGYSGDDTFTYSAEYGTTSSSATVTIHVVNFPVLATDDYFLGTLAEEGRDFTTDTSDWTGSVLANDIDLEDNPLVVGWTMGNYGDVEMSPNGTFRYILRSTPEPGSTVTDSFQYTVSDGLTQSTATVWLTLTPADETSLVQPATDASNADGPVPAGQSLLVADTQRWQFPNIPALRPNLNPVQAAKVELAIAVIQLRAQAQAKMLDWLQDAFGNRVFHLSDEAALWTNIRANSIDGGVSFGRNAINPDAAFGKVGFTNSQLNATFNMPILDRNGTVASVEKLTLTKDGLSGKLPVGAGSFIEFNNGIAGAQIVDGNYTFAFDRQTKQLTVRESLLDPTTGQPAINPGTGQLVTREVVQVNPRQASFSPVKGLDLTLGSKVLTIVSERLGSFTVELNDDKTLKTLQSTLKLGEDRTLSLGYTNNGTTPVFSAGLNTPSLSFSISYAPQKLNFIGTYIYNASTSVRLPLGAAVTVTSDLTRGITNFGFSIAVGNF